MANKKQKTLNYNSALMAFFSLGEREVFLNSDLKHA